MPAQRVASCIFCDDIRQEAGNKFSLMGIYGSDFNIPISAQMILIPKFGIAVQLITDIDDVPEKITISIFIPPNRQELAKIEMEKPNLENQKDSTKAHIRALLPLQPFNLSEDGSIEVMIDTERESIRAGRLFVKFLPSENPTASA